MVSWKQTHTSQTLRYFKFFSLLGVLAFLGIICLYRDTAPVVIAGERIDKKKQNANARISEIEKNRTVASDFSNYQFDVKQSSGAARLPKKGSIFCWISTSPKYFDTRVPAVNETWLKRCDHGEFFTTEPIEDESIPFSTVFTGLNDSYDELFYKSIRAFHYSYTLSKDFDWYLKADDDTYVIMEHLREFLSGHDPKTPLYFGYTWHTALPKGYNSGGAGYVLSKAAVKLFVEELYNDSTLCPFDKFEDVGIARCLASKGIFPGRTKNSKNQERFSYTTIKEALKFIPLGKDLITLHWQQPDELRMLEHLIYKLDNPRQSKYNHIN